MIGSVAYLVYFVGIICTQEYKLYLSVHGLCTL